MSAASTDALPVELREHEPADLAFILDAWITNYQRSREVADLVPSVYCPAQRTQILRLLRAGKAVVAFNRDRPDQLFGFIAYERDDNAKVVVVHYVYAKKTFRGFGIGARLVDHAVRGTELRYYTHRAPRLEDEAVLRKRGVKFNLYLR